LDELIFAVREQRN